jgi:tetratricopeptide (TPR) repeat protein
MITGLGTLCCVCRSRLDVLIDSTTGILLCQQRRLLVADHLAGRRWGSLTAYDLKRFRDASLLYEQLLRIAPNRSDLWKTEGAIYLYELEDRDAALRCFRRALLLEPDPGEKAKLEGLVKELGG